MQLIGNHPKEITTMRHFLIFLPLVEEHAHLHERVLANVRTFFETTASAERVDIGLFERRPRPNRPSEHLPLVVIKSPAGKSFERDISRARALESALRSTLDAAGVAPVDVRVFVESAATTEDA